MLGIEKIGIAGRDAEETGIEQFGAVENAVAKEPPSIGERIDKLAQAAEKVQEAAADQQRASDALRASQ